jgi:alanine dehydrogenase
MSEKITLGLIASSNKENEKRVAIHPAHFHLFGDAGKEYVWAERGYGKNFRIPDSEFEPYVAGLLDREELFERCDAVMIFKPTAPDFPFFREGQILWGACHNVQNEDIVQVGIDKKMTFIAMESMFRYRPDGKKDVWLFHTQSELAGYCSVLHALQLLGTKGWYDQPRKAAIISFGSVGRGALQALTAFDFNDITVFTQRHPVAVLWSPPTVALGQYVRDQDRDQRTLVLDETGGTTRFGEVLADYDIIVNCVAQDTDRPLMFVEEDDVARLKRGTLIVDVSCDRGLGFSFARPTTFDEPMFEVGNRVVYYGVDHSPSYLFNTASLEHSKEAAPYVVDVVGGRQAWQDCPTIDNAVEIDQGRIINRKILTYQNREEEYPHRKRG